MAFPNVASSVVGASTSVANTHDASKPSGLAVGDLLTLSLGSVATTGASGSTMLGWTLLEHNNATNLDVQLEVWAKEADSGDVAASVITLSFAEGAPTEGHMCWSIRRIPAGEWTGDIADVVAAVASSNTSTPDAPNLSPSFGSGDHLWIEAVHWYGDRSHSSYAANTSNQHTARFADEAGLGVASGTRQLTAASENPGSHTVSDSGSWAASTICVRETTSITGSAAITEAADSSSATGTHTYTITGSTPGGGGIIEGADTSAASGTLTITGATAGGGGIIEGADDSTSSTGTVTISITGSAATIEGADTSTASGTAMVTATGSASTTGGADTSAASGSLTISGSSVNTESSDSSATSGLLTISGTSANTEGAETSTSSGTATTEITGSASTTENADTSTASGTATYTITGSSATIESADASTASGTVSITVTGSAATIEGADTSTASGTVTGTASGTSATTEGADTSAASGTLTITGSSATTEGADTSAATGSAVTEISGSAATTEGADTSAASGTLTITGTAEPTEAADTSAASGTSTVEITGTAATTEGADTSAASGTLTITGSAATTERADPGVSVARVRQSGPLPLPDCCCCEEIRYTDFCECRDGTVIKTWGSFRVTIDGIPDTGGCDCDSLNGTYVVGCGGEAINILYACTPPGTGTLSLYISFTSDVFGIQAGVTIERVFSVGGDTYYHRYGHGVLALANLVPKYKNCPYNDPKRLETINDISCDLIVSEGIRCYGPGPGVPLEIPCGDLPAGYDVCDFSSMSVQLEFLEEFL